MIEERFYILIRDWHHPYRTYPKGCVYNAAVWASYLGAGTTAEEFEQFFEAGRFKGWIQEYKTPSE